MMLRRIPRLFMMIFFCIFSFASPVFAEKGSLEQAQLEFVCALVSMSSYDDEASVTLRRRLQEMGWEYDAFVEGNRTANSHLFMVRRVMPNSGKKVSILAIRGSSSMKDAEVDLRTHRVPFGGTTPAEFRTIAMEEDRKDSRPLVHQGFNDYTNTALFSKTKGDEDASLSLGELLAQELIASPSSKLILTGHSLGGAVAVLAAARLSDMGVQPHQLDIVTFGAPEVGNLSFVERYNERFHLDRIVMSGDPVKNILRSLRGGYAQFPQHTDRKQNKNSRKFSHNMAVYLDSAMRNLYDTVKNNKGVELPTDLFESQSHVNAKVYVVINLSLDDLIENDTSYVRDAIQDMLDDWISHPIFGMSEDGETMSELREKARNAGCDYILVENLSGIRSRKERYNFRITLEEVLYDTEGRTLEIQSNSITTKSLTPIIAALYVQMAGRETREAALEKFASGKF